jgi:hypothetical protein
MANINVSAPSQFVNLYVSTATITSTTATGVLLIPALQDVTVTNNNGVFRWKQLDEIGQKVAVTPATNSLNLTLVVDDSSFYGTAYGTAPAANDSASKQGLFNLSNYKSKVYFKFGWGGTSTNFVSGSGYLSGLAPKVTPDQPVWITPLVIEVDGTYTPSNS